MTRLLVLACILLSIAAAVAGEKELRVPMGGDVYTLHPFSGTSPRHHYFGEYAMPSQATGGTKLHLFPNGRFVISEWLDIGTDDLRAAGTFRLEGDRLSLQFSRVQRDHKDLKTKFSDLHLLWGWIEKKGSVMGFQVFIFPAPAWRALKADPSKADYLKRITEYNEWQTILHDYEAGKK